MNEIKFKHDTWISLKPNSPYQSILSLFPDEKMPARDPFPMTIVEDEIPLWTIDLERLTNAQACSLVHLTSAIGKEKPIEVANEAYKNGGFAMNNFWVDEMWCGEEGLHRTKELIEFLQITPPPVSEVALRSFYASQYSRWVEGDKIPSASQVRSDISYTHRSTD